MITNYDKLMHWCIVWFKKPKKTGENSAGRIFKVLETLQIKDFNNLIWNTNHGWKVPLSHNREKYLQSSKISMIKGSSLYIQNCKKQLSIKGNH